MEFVNRKKELELLREYFNAESGNILILYGPKSTGKTTMLSHFIQQELTDKKYAVNMLNLRGMLIFNFRSFLDRFFPKKLSGKVKDVLTGITINSGFFGVSVDEEAILKDNPFQVMEEKLTQAKSRGIQPILIIDEIQQLKSIYLNGDRNLLDELLNLFVRLTKELHVAHIILATSDSYFLNEIYGNAKLAKTTDFFYVGQFEKETVVEWLQSEKFSEAEIEESWHWTGGNPFELGMIVNKKSQGRRVLESCMKIVSANTGMLSAWTVFHLSGAEKRSLVYEILEKIAGQGRFHLPKEEVPMLQEVIRELVDKDFCFFHAEKRSLIANSESMRHAMVKFLEKANQ